MFSWRSEAEGGVGRWRGVAEDSWPPRRETLAEIHLFQLRRKRTGVSEGTPAVPRTPLILQSRRSHRINREESSGDARRWWEELMSACPAPEDLSPSSFIVAPLPCIDLCRHRCGSRSPRKEAFTIVGGASSCPGDHVCVVEVSSGCYGGAAGILAMCYDRDGLRPQRGRKRSGGGAWLQLAAL